MCCTRPVSRSCLLGALVCVALASMASAALAQQSPVGTWDLTYSVGDRQLAARLTITKTDDGSLVGKWNSQRGGDGLSEMKSERGSLTFVREFKLGGREMRLDFRGRIEGNKLSGVFASPRGEFEVNGTRTEPAAPAPDRSRQGSQRGSGKPSPTHADVSYGPHENNVIDVWLADSPTLTPLVLFIHGGGFRGGSKSSIQATTLNALLSAGISVAAVEYRFISVKPLPTAHHDSCRALQFLRSKAGDWNFDKTRVGAYGGSAGAQLCMWLAFHDEMADPTGSDPIARESTRLTCVATSGGQTTMDLDWWMKWIPDYDVPHRDASETYGTGSEEAIREIVADISALSLISSDDPPIYMQYGQKPDDPVPTDPEKAQGWKVHHVTFGIKLKERMDELGVEANLQHPGATTSYGSQERFFIEKLAKGE